MKTGFIGVGNMGGAILRSFAASDNIDTGSLYIYSRTVSKTEALARELGVKTCGSAAELIREKEIDESRFYSILNKLDVPKAKLERDLRLLSEGQRKKVLLAASLCERAHLHVWDEPLNYIDVISRIQIEELLLRFRPTIVFVEHDKAFCEHVATRIVSMQKA